MMKRVLLVVLLLSGCAVAESGDVTVFTCPSCPGVYDGFSTCAFYDVDEAWARSEMLVDEDNYFGVGSPIVQSGLMHHKFCFNETHAVVGSANPTENGLLLNDNLLVLFESRTMAENFAIEYNYLSSDSYGFHVTDWTFNDRPISQLFCPRDRCEERVLSVLSSARDSVRFMTFAFTSDAIGDLLVRQYEEGVVVEGVFERLGQNMVGSEYDKLVEAGIPVLVVDTPGVMHHKVFLVDEETVVFGSYNPTGAATSRNAETVVVTREPVVVRAVLAEFSRLSTQYGYK